MRIVFDLGQAQQFIGMGNDLGERTHPAIVQLPGGFEAQKLSNLYQVAPETERSLDEDALAATISGG